MKVKRNGYSSLSETLHIRKSDGKFSELIFYWLDQIFHIGQLTNTNLTIFINFMQRRYFIIISVMASCHLPGSLQQPRSHDHSSSITVNRMKPWPHRKWWNFIRVATILRWGYTYMYMMFSLRGSGRTRSCAISKCWNIQMAIRSDMHIPSS